jgi:NADH-quinone oxidoreductase subunit L
VRNVFVVGALALMGIPLLNGFWSKELVLESGLAFGEEHGMLWAYAVMVLVAGLTALYTARCLWMVFMGENRGQLHAHGTGTAMKVALAPLALGTLVTWLLAEPFLKLLETVPSYHALLAEVESGWALLVEVVSAPATLLALAVIGLGLLAWVYRSRLLGVTRMLQGLSTAAEASFGFEAINRGVVKIVQAGAEELRVTQTGLVNWNVLGVVAGLVVVLIILVLGR